MSTAGMILAPPVPTIAGEASGLTPTFIGLTPREQMRLAKVALMRDEASEADAQRERRRSQRGWSLALDWETKRVGSASRRASEAASSIAPLTPASPTSSTSPTSPTSPGVRPQPPSILRRPSALSDTMSSTASSSLRTSMTEVSEFGLCTDPTSPRPSAGRRRSSKVRFSEAHLPSAKSSPASAIAMLRQESVDSIQLTALPGQPKAEAPAPPVSPTFVVRPAKQLPRSLESGSPVRPIDSRKSSTNSLLSDLSGTSRQGLEDMFKAQPLPYSKLDKVLARLDSECAAAAERERLSASSASSTESSVVASAGSAASVASEASSARSSLVPPLTLRQTLDRSSLSVPPAKLSVASDSGSSVSAASLVSPPSLRRTLNRPSLTLSSSTLSITSSSGSSFSSGPQVSTPGSLRLSGNSTSFATMGEYLARAGRFSVSTSGSSGGSSGLVSPLGNISGMGCYFDRIEEQKATDAALAVNRQAWDDPDAGLSPRSTPTPVAPDTEVIETPLQPAWESPESQRSDLPEGRPHADSVDLLPIMDRMSISSATSLGDMRTRGHQKEDSDFSIDLSFPVPPNRLAIKFGKLAPKKKLAVSVAPVVAEVAVEMGILEDDGDEADAESEVEEKPTPRLGGPASPASGKTSPATPTMDGTLTAALRSIGSPTTGGFLVPHSPTKQAGGLLLSLNSPAAPERPPSPDISTMMMQTVESLRRRKSSVYPYAQFEEDSDIDLAAPLEEVAYKSRILSPKSRLLSRSSSKSSRPSRRASTISSSSLRSGVGLTSGRGWSGSESEEEEWSTSLRLLQNRKVRKSVLAREQQSQQSQPQRPVWAKQADRLSQASQTSTLSTMSSMTADSGVSHASTELLTPSGSMDMPQEHTQAYTAPELRRTASSASSSSNSTIPGNFPWGKASPDHSPRLRSAELARRRSSARSIGSNGGMGNLPTPTREVTGWGEPEKMFGETTDEENEMDLEAKMAAALDDETPRPPAAHVVPQSGAYFYQAAAAHIEDRLAGLFGRTPAPRAVSDPMTASAAAAVAVPKPAAPKVESRIPRARPVSVVRPVQQEQQCAACRFF